MRFGRSAASASNSAPAPTGVRSGRRRAQFGWRTRILAASAAALALPLAAVVTVPAAASATPIAHPVRQTPPGGYQELMVPSPMGPVKVQVQWARRGGNAALLMLDGL